MRACVCGCVGRNENEKERERGKAGKHNRQYKQVVKCIYVNAEAKSDVIIDGNYMREVINSGTLEMRRTTQLTFHSLSKPFLVSPPPSQVHCQFWFFSVFVYFSVELISVQFQRKLLWIWIQIVSFLILATNDSDQYKLEIWFISLNMGRKVHTTRLFTHQINSLTEK